MRDARGQGTLEYLAVVLVIALVIAAAAAVVAGTGVGEQVVAAVRRALCVVAGGPCDERAEDPCVRAARQHADGGHISLPVVRLGTREVELREQRADGTVALTLIEEKSLGADVGTYGNAEIRWGRTTRAFGAELRTALLAEHASGRTWVARDAAAAQRLHDQVRRADLARRPERTIPLSEERPDWLPRRPHAHAPPPEVTFSELGATASLDLHRLGRDLHLAVGEAYGERVERSTGRRTLYVRERASGRGSLSIAKVGLRGDAAADVRYGLTFDREGRPLEFEVLAALDVQGAVDLPPRLAAIAGMLRVPSSGQKHLETEQHLDLTDPRNRELAEAFFSGGPAVRLALAARLRERLAEAGSTRVRSYDVDATAHGAGAHLRIAGIGVGVDGGSEDEVSRLVSAVVRDRGGAWRPDPACA